MKKKIQVAQKGQKIIDLLGYVYTVNEIHEKYVSVGNGQFIVHHEYEILPNGSEKEVQELLEVVQTMYSDFGRDVVESVFAKILNRYDSIENKEEDYVQYGCTFEDYVELEGDDKYEYEFKRGGSSIS